MSAELSTLKDEATIEKAREQAEAYASLLKVETEDSVPLDRAYGGIPYVGFFGAGAKAPTVARLTPAGITVGTFYLDHIAPIKVEPFTLHLLRYTRLFTTQDREMNLTAARLSSDDDAFKAGFREHLFCVVAVRLPTFDEKGKPTGMAFVPAEWRPRGGQTKALEKTIALLPYAKDKAAWSARGAVYAASTASAHPGGRIVTTVWNTVEGQPGNEFNLGAGAVRPTPADEAAAFQAWFASSHSQIAAVVRSVDQKVAEARELLVD